MNVPPSLETVDEIDRSGPSAVSFGAVMAQRQAAVTRTVLRVLVGAVVLVSVLSLLEPLNGPVITVITYAPLAGLLLAGLWLVRNGRARTAAWLASIVVFIAVFLVTWFYGGLKYQNATPLIVCIMIAGATLGSREALAFAGASAAGSSFVLYAELSGLLPASLAPDSAFNAFLGVTIPLGLASYLLHLALTNLRDTIVVSEKRASERDEARKKYLHSQKLDLVGRLSSGVAHDFNNILTVVFTVGDQLRTELVGPNEHLTAYVDEIKSASERAALLTRRLLLFSKPGDEQPTTVDVGALLQELAPLQQRMVGDTIRLEWAQSETPLTICINPSAFEQILLNLLINAREAMPEGGTVFISCGTKGSNVWLEVRDTGLGMTSEVEAKLFDPFFTTKRTGTGLGLSTVKDLAEAVGGVVSVLSGLDTGCAFRIEWPKVDANDDGNPSAAPLQFGLEQKRILVVDDNELVRRAVSSMLEGSGANVASASDSLAALSLLERDARFDLVISDVAMHGMSGLEFAAHIREAYPDLPALLVSGVPPGDALPEGVQFLAKPFGRDELVSKIQLTLQGSAEARFA
jgi:signal transduction histidine kinase/CheY-like chemotaxis protein